MPDQPSMEAVRTRTVASDVITGEDAVDGPGLQGDRSSRTPHLDNVGVRPRRGGGSEYPGGEDRIDDPIIHGRSRSSAEVGRTKFGRSLVDRDRRRRRSRAEYPAHDGPEADVPVAGEGD